MQHRMRRFGSFAPAGAGVLTHMMRAGHGADGPVDQLLRLNLLFYLVEVALLFNSISEFVLFGFSFGIVSLALVVFVNPFLWFALRAILGQQVRLATNARRVLSTMDAAATIQLIPGPRGSDRLLATNAQQHAAARGLESLLANLPCTHRTRVTYRATHPELSLGESAGVGFFFISLQVAALLRVAQRDSNPQSPDAFTLAQPWNRESYLAGSHRDVLVIRELIGSLPRCPDYAPSAHAVRALAFSAHMAARMQPSAGDGAAELSLDDWLRERNSSLDALTTRLSGKAMLQAQEGLPLAELRSLGWVPAPGVTCAFIAPVGTLTISPPSQDGTWSMASAVPLPRPRLAGIPISVFWAQQFVYGLVNGSVLQARLANKLGADSAHAIQFFLAITELLLLGIPLTVWVVDFASVRARWLKVPLPLKVFNGVRENVIALAATAASSGIFIYLVVDLSTLLSGGLGGGGDGRGGDGGGEGNSDRFAVPRRLLQVAVNGLVGSFLLYEASLYAIFAACQAKHFSQFGEQSQRVDIGSMPASTRVAQCKEAGWFMRFLATSERMRSRRRGRLQEDERAAKLELKNLESTGARSSSTP